MLVIDPAWSGKVQFYELLFGIWTVYVLLVLMWERVLRAPLPEWKYVLINFMGAGAFWINHYFQKAPFWFVMLNAYTAIFLVVWWRLGISGPARSARWKVTALFGAIVYTVAFIGLEQLSRLGVERYGVNEFWFMAASFFGFIAVILWRGRRSAFRREPDRGRA